jgi:hypothetical protein
MTEKGTPPLPDPPEARPPRERLVHGFGRDSALKPRSSRECTKNRCDRVENQPNEATDDTIALKIS